MPPWVAPPPLATSMPKQGLRPTLPVLSHWLPRKSALQVRDLGLGQFADQRVDPGDGLSLSVREILGRRTAGPGRPTSLRKCRQDSACQRRYDAPTHGRAEGQEV